MLIYQVTNLTNNKIYIGKTTKTLEDRKTQHFYALNKIDLYFYRAINKYGWDKFHWEVIEECQTEEELNEREKYWIKTLETYIPTIGYNCTMGGDGSTSGPGNYFFGKRGKDCPRFGKHLSEETKRKLSIAHKGLKFSKEHIQNLSKSHLGKLLTEEQKKKISERLKGVNHPFFGKHHTKESNYKNKIAHLGRHHTEEAKRKVSIASMGRIVSEETRKKISIANTGKHHCSEGTRRKMAESRIHYFLKFGNYKK